MRLGHGDYTTCQLSGTPYVRGCYRFQVLRRCSCSAAAPLREGLRRRAGLREGPVARGLKALGGENLFLENADVGEVSVGAGEVQAVADDELVGDLEAKVLDVEVHLAPGGLCEEGTDLQGSGFPRPERAHEVGEGQAGVYDVFDDENVAAGNVLFQVLEDADDTARGGARTVGANVHEVQLARQVDFAHQVAHNHDGAAEDADEEEPLALVVFGDAGAHLSHFALNVGRGDQDLLHVWHHAGHVHGLSATSTLSIRPVSALTAKGSPSSPKGIQATSP